MLYIFTNEEQSTQFTMLDFIPTYFQSIGNKMQKCFFTKQNISKENKIYHSSSHNNNKTKASFKEEKYYPIILQATIAKSRYLIKIHF